jgi:hypothetical protein
MLQEDKVMRYVLYAIGEIILVVVGILIALQVNTWNEDRKARTFEVVILQEIRENVRGNLKRFMVLERRLQTSDAGIHLLLVELGRAKPDRARLAHYFSILNNGIVFTYNRGAYDSFKAAGLDRLSNRALRSQLIDHFDSFLPRYDRFIEIHFSRVMGEGKTSEVDLQVPVIVRNVNELQRVEMEFPADFNWSGREFLTIISAYSDANHASHLRLQRVIAETEAMLSALDAEIDGSGVARSKQQPIQQTEKPIPKRTL